MTNVREGAALLVRHVLNGMLQAWTSDDGFPHSLLMQLLEPGDGGDEDLSEFAERQGPSPRWLQGLPPRPLYAAVADELCRLLASGDLCRMKPLDMPGVKEEPVLHRLNASGLLLFMRSVASELQSPPGGKWRWCCLLPADPLVQIRCGDAEDVVLSTGIVWKCENVLRFMLGPRGVLALLGMRRTEGSVDACPPPRQSLEAAFQRPNKPGSRSPLTVGARAVSKHCPRAGDGFWGSCRGSEIVKNSAATRLLHQILDECVWVNMHRMTGLNSADTIVELRCSSGYGMRWVLCGALDGDQPVACVSDSAAADGDHARLTFRGCLEPAMEDGHEVGWHH